MTKKTAAVIGGGPAGLACAQMLAQAGVAVEVLEKSRGLGGRAATKRIGDLSFDHGAQYVTARGRAFRALMQDLLHGGSAAVWRPRLPDGDDAPEDWHVGAPGMSALLRPWATGLTVRTQALARAIRRRADGRFEIDLDDGAAAGPYDAVATAAPAPQAVALLEMFGAPFDRIAAAPMSPCWTLLAAATTPAGATADLLRPLDGPIQWAARNNSRPGRAATPERWTLHCAYDWSLAHIDWTPEAVAAALAPQVQDLLGLNALDLHYQAHRWRYALADAPLGQTCLMTEDGRLGACGDWCLAPRVESAIDSGLGLGAAMAAALGATRA